jgi:alkylation response protein AidB-like acyl-CoA dehydrogenase
MPMSGPGALRGFSRVAAKWPIGRVNGSAVHCRRRNGGFPELRRRAALLLDVLTPIAKSRPSQWCLAANDLAIQVHGGYGYTREYSVEQFYRDNRLNPIHEGTHGIQDLDRTTLDMNPCWF